MRSCSCCRDLGHEGDADAAGLAGVDALATIADLVERGEQLVEQLDDDPGLAPIVAEVVLLGQDLLAAIDALRDVDGGALHPTLDDPDLWRDLAEALPGHLLVQHLEAELPLVYAALRVCGVIAEHPTASGGTREVVVAEQLGTVVSDPIAAIADRYGWGGTSGFEHAQFLDDLALILTTLGCEVRTGPAGEVVLPFVSGFGAGGFIDAGLALAPLAPGTGGQVDGVAITNTMVGSADVSLEIIDGWSVEVPVSLSSSGAVGLELKPQGAALQGELPGDRVTWALSGDPAEPWRLLGGLIETGGVDVELSIAGPAGDAELVLAAGCRDTAITLSPSDGDSFLQDLVGADQLRIELSPRLEWSSRSGLAIEGTVGLDVVIPLTLRLGPLLVERLHLRLTGGTDGARLEAGVDATAQIGPIVATASDIGVAVELAPAADRSGSLGAFDLQLAFKPPDGVGLGVDLGVVSGGGYLDIDVEAGSYDGVLDLEVLGVGVCAVAIIDTKLPDVDGWSMFFALFLDLPSIQLGFGFTLTGVGGVAGINRAIDVDALGSAVRSGSLDTILFPEDPIADAPIIIEEFRSIFPPADGSYVFGPIVKIGWGTPALIEAELGIIIQLPDPLVIVVMGSLSAVLPNKDLALVALNLDVAGAIDFEAGTLAIDASLHDSQIVGFALSGDMALRAEFGNAQAFLMSVGGFHPRFDPPGDFPDLRPVTFGITAGSVLRIDFMSYFALTSNSVQCGADFTLDADVMGFGVYGSCGFDALIQFSPFMLITSVEFEVSITAAGVDLMGVKLYASVEGPNRWHVIGTARFEVLGFGKDIRVDELIGSKESEPAVEAAEVLEELIAALATDDAWRVIEANDSAVTLQEIEDPNAPLMATPDSVIEVRQTLVPLGIDIEQFGNAPVGDHSTFELTAVGLDQSGTLDDWFAPGQFFELGNDDKLEGPEFELMRSGIQFGGGAPIAGEDVGVDTGYKPFIIDPEFPEEETFLGYTSVVYDLTGVSKTAHTQSGFTAVQTELVGTTSPKYIVVDDGGATVTSTTTWSAAYTASTGRSDLHIEREMAISA